MQNSITNQSLYAIFITNTYTNQDWRKGGQKLPFGEVNSGGTGRLRALFKALLRGGGGRGIESLVVLISLILTDL